MYKVKNWSINLFLFFSLIGILDAGYLTLNYLQGENVGCFLVKGCDIVLKSNYADIFGIPVAALGLAYYSLIFFGVLLYNFNRKNFLIRRISQFTFVGFLATLWFLYLQTFVIKEFCSYCLVSAVTSIALFLLSIYVVWLLKGSEKSLRSDL